jgi:predicted O-methyltransferase YrrM
MIVHSQKSLDLLAEISKTVKTFHHHFHVLYDIASMYEGEINYVEIGCYAGASACLMTQRPKTNVFSIDTGTPISPNIAYANVLRYNYPGNKFEYIQGSSHDVNIVNRIRNSVHEIDILFIDGGHSFTDVTQDFEMYSGMVKPGGYIVFDDYMDSQFSPEVRPAIDRIVSCMGNRYEVIGCMKNEIGAFPSTVTESNCFILKKNIAKIGVVIATYQRPDGKTPAYLRRALASIHFQTFKNFQVYVIGDHYDNDMELKTIITPYPNVTCINLPHSVEREKYKFGDMKLWCSGGLTAFITGIDHALKDGIEYICHLDHDDSWEINHLELINRVIEEKNPFFVCTASSYNTVHLPYKPLNNEIEEFYPVPGGMIASSSCVKYSDTKLRYRDVFEATGTPNPGDADLWIRLTEEMKQTGRKGYFIKTLTCHHDEEGYALRGR